MYLVVQLVCMEEYAPRSLSGFIPANDFKLKFIIRQKQFFNIFFFSPASGKRSRTKYLTKVLMPKIKGKKKFASVKSKFMKKTLVKQREKISPIGQQKVKV